MVFLFLFFWQANFVGVCFVGAVPGLNTRSTMEYTERQRKRGKILLYILLRYG